MKLRNALLVLMLLTSLTLSARTKQDVIHLKNGEVVKGKIVAQEFNTMVQIRTADGNVLTFQMDEVEMINTEGEVKDASVGVRNGMWERGAIEMITGYGHSLYSFQVLREVRAAKVNLAEISIPDSVTVIGDEAFRLCPKLTKVSIPNSVTTIGSYAFDYCSSLYTLNIGSGVTNIGNYAFDNCDRLYELYCYPVTPPSISSKTFTKKNTFLYVPQGSLEEYKSKWGDYFTNISEMD